MLLTKLVFVEDLFFFFHIFFFFFLFVFIFIYIYFFSFFFCSSFKQSGGGSAGWCPAGEGGMGDGVGQRRLAAAGATT